MAFRDLKNTATARIQADDENPGRYRAVVSPRKVRAEDSKGDFVPFEAVEIGGGRITRIHSAAANFDAIRASGAFSFYSNGFRRPLLTMEIVVERRNQGGQWRRVSLAMERPTDMDRTGKGSDYAGWAWPSVGDGALSVSFEQRLGRSKWLYDYAAANPGEYRTGILVLVQGNPVYRPLARNGVRNGAYFSEIIGANWDFGVGEEFGYSWADMIDTGVIDAGAIEVGPRGMAVYSTSFVLSVGQHMVIDPTTTQDASSAGAGASGDSAWGIDTGSVSGENSIACGVVSGSINIRRYTRYDITFMSAGSTVNDFQFEPYVNGVGPYGGSTIRVGPWNGNGQGNPASGSYATAYAAADVTSDNYLTGQTYGATTGRKDLDLGATADSDLAAARSAGDYFSLAEMLEQTDGNRYSWIGSDDLDAHGPDIYVDWTEPAGGALSGTASATTTASATLAGAGALSGTASATATASGVIAGAGAVSGTSNATSTASGVIAAQGALSGTSSASGTASGTLSGSGAVSGTASATGAATGLLAGVGALSGTASGDATATGVLAGAGALAGTSSAEGTASGVLAGLGGNALSGTASATGDASGTLSAIGALSGSASATSSASAIISGVGGLSGSASGSADASGTLAGSGSLSGTASGLCVAIGVLAAIGALSGVASATASASGVLTDGITVHPPMGGFVVYSKNPFTTNLSSRSSASMRESSK